MDGGCNLCKDVLCKVYFDEWNNFVTDDFPVIPLILKVIEIIG